MRHFHITQTHEGFLLALTTKQLLPLGKCSVRGHDIKVMSQSGRPNYNAVVCLCLDSNCGRLVGHHVFSG